MQTFLAFLLVWDDSKTLMENLQACFQMSARLLDNKRTGKQRVEAMQLLNILLNRNPDSSWKRHPVLQMWAPWVEALKLYYNCFIEEWVARGFVNNLPLETVDEKALEEQGLPPFLTNKHFIDRHRANLMTKHPEFYKQYNWDVEPRVGYYWYLDGTYVLTKYSKRFDHDLSGDQAPAEPEEPERKRRKRKSKDIKSGENGGENEEEHKRSPKKKQKQSSGEEEGEEGSTKRNLKSRIKKEESEDDAEAEQELDDDFKPRTIKRERSSTKRHKIKKESVENNQDQANEEESEEKLERSAKRKQEVADLVSSFAFGGAGSSTPPRRANRVSPLVKQEAQR